ncbi:MAG: S-methyl-5-thioribose-1-phosphate isomerase [Verrucomicrobia bacterium]|nr:S-methyl-5-thioribose-1-phosphate isomerase [Verrucomicrobiota bacterium]
MKTLESLALSFRDQQLRVLDQQKLPFVEEWLTCHSPDEMVEIIKELKVRGAPLIGVAAALSLAHYVEMGATREQVELAAQKLIGARPTAYNLSHCISRQMAAFAKSGDLSSIIDMAEKLFEEDRQLSMAIAEHGASLIQSGESILTHCNTGGLVTTGIGTALGAMIQAHRNGKKIHVFVDETRPLLQGARLTCWELEKEGIPHTLICDNMAASMMQKGKVHRVIVGADRIATNGDTANKIGTYSVAALCFLHNIPFHIAAPRTTIDYGCSKGEEIEIEERKPHEVKGAVGTFGDIKWAPKASAVCNPAFDVTPAKWIESFITDAGVFRSIASIGEKII